MTLLRPIAAALALSAAALPAMAEPASHDVFDTFYTQNGNSRITITDCGDGTPCGRVTWIDPASLADGVTPETATTHAGDPLLGLLMLQGFEEKKNDWRGGTIYNPKEDKTYSARIKRLGDGDLQLKGCVGPICQTQVWRQYSGE